jgi:hypothetical protein
MTHGALLECREVIQQFLDSARKALGGLGVSPACSALVRLTDFLSEQSGRLGV